MSDVTVDVRTGAVTEHLSPEAKADRARQSMQCTPAQMRLALHRAGLLATVQAIADSDPEASIVWEYATVILRNSPFIAALQCQSGMTPEELDNLFIAAMAI